MKPNSATTRALSSEYLRGIMKDTLNIWKGSRITWLKAADKKKKDHVLHNFAWVLFSGYYTYLFTSWTEVIEMSRSLSFPALLKYLSKILNKVRE